MVTSLHDGMNLVAKEYVAARDDDEGALILSRVHRRLPRAARRLLVNPYDVEDVASALYQVLTMPMPPSGARAWRGCGRRCASTTSSAGRACSWPS